MSLNIDLLQILVIVHFHTMQTNHQHFVYRGADKSLDQPTSQCILFDVENISFDASLVMYISNTNIPSVMIINRIYEHQNLM
jgi:hypothetical protein